MTLQMIIRAAAVATLATATMSMAACGSSSTTTGSAPAPAATTTAATTTAAKAADDGCGGDVVDAVKKAVTSSAVKKIEVIGGCSEVSIETSLQPGALSDGVAICQAASKVAYTGSISAVSVDGSDGHELAAGEKNQPCI